MSVIVMRPGTGPVSSQAQTYEFVNNTSHNATDKTIVLCDTTSNAVEIVLPTATTYAGKWFHIKWKAGTTENSLTISAQPGETIDSYAQILMGLVHDSLNIFSDGTDWWII